ncbi:hypothetical protein M4L39_05660 [Staphylococcus equorum]|uniref:Beta-ketoacyl-[acyl-carrier-protein] synthase III N-terminal domain-containing protein n=1 Tax=Staphylococcus equorum TaxID=246432 RepID=A0A9X4R1R5_9STAP|nr:hypothetical protein [Staphylococcus equorum]MDG0842923.1 hypothetical protein [Staphylococcus equorum]MDG0859455.1 hypothetical protein [Staphylococcus equorum]
MKSIWEIDINAACARFPCGLNIANELLASGQNKKVLVTEAETLSKRLITLIEAYVYYLGRLPVPF